jgi:hypothetical protein
MRITYNKTAEILIDLNPNTKSAENVIVKIAARTEQDKESVATCVHGELAG